MRKLILIVIFVCSHTGLFAQTFYFNSQKFILKEHKKKQKKLLKKEKLNLPFPLRTVWLKDSIFIDEFEVTLKDWANDYLPNADTGYYKSEEYSKLTRFNVDSIYNLKSYESYLELIKYSVLLSNPFIAIHKLDKPIVFQDSSQIFDYISLLNKEVNPLISGIRKHWYWSKNFTPNYEVEYDLLTIDEYLLALKRFKKWTPKIKITESIEENIPVPSDKHKNYKEGEEVLGLLDNASEIVLYNNQLYVIYKADEEYLYISKFKNPDYHIGFRLKCLVKARKT